VESKFGEWLRRERLASGVTLRAFAIQAGISATYLSKIERGEFKPPSEEVIKRICVLLGVKPDYGLAMAGKVSSDLIDIIIANPVDYGNFLRHHFRQLSVK
jgi:transcriptional regulator with XRE-family HTH domain